MTDHEHDAGGCIECACNHTPFNAVGCTCDEISRRFLLTRILTAIFAVGVIGLSLMILVLIFAGIVDILSWVF